MTKQLLAKLSSGLIVILGFVDTNLQVLQGIGLEDLTINWIKFIGLSIAALLPAIPLTFKSRKKAIIMDASDDEIGGGGIKNPPKP